MDWNTNGWGNDNWVAMSLMMMFWLAILGFVIWTAVRLAGRSNSPSMLHETPRSVLDRRLASGEIDAEQYSQLRRLLDGRTVNDQFLGSAPTSDPR